jgi:hypothetical protein
VRRPTWTGELLVALADWKLRTAILRRLPTCVSADVLATMSPVDAAACLAKLPKAGGVGLKGPRGGLGTSL